MIAVLVRISKVYTIRMPGKVASIKGQWAAKPPKVPGEASQKKKLCKESYSIYIYKVLKQPEWCLLSSLYANFFPSNSLCTLGFAATCHGWGDAKSTALCGTSILQYTMHLVIRSVTTYLLITTLAQKM